MDPTHALAATHLGSSQIVGGLVSSPRPIPTGFKSVPRLLTPECPPTREKHFNKSSLEPYSDCVTTCSEKLSRRLALCCSAYQQYLLDSPTSSSQGTTETRASRRHVQGRYLNVGPQIYARTMTYWTSTTVAFLVLRMRSAGHPVMTVRGKTA